MQGDLQEIAIKRLSSEGSASQKAKRSTVYSNLSGLRKQEQDGIPKDQEKIMTFLKNTLTGKMKKFDPNTKVEKDKGWTVVKKIRKSVCK